MSIYVCNKRSHLPTTDDIYIGRPSVLGNPFVMNSEADRMDVVERYREWLRANWQNTTVRDKLIWLARRYKAGNNIYLVCWCAPKACHGDVIKDAI